MADDARTSPPLASYVLRIRGKPATLRYELHDLRSGDRHVFLSAERLAAHLRRHGLEVEDARPDTGPIGDPD